MRSRNLGTTDGPERSITYLAVAAAIVYAAVTSVGATTAAYTGEAAVVGGVFVTVTAATALYVDRTLTPGFWVAAPAAAVAPPATAAVAAGFVPASTWTHAAVASAWAFTSGAALAAAVERDVDLRNPAYAVGFVLTGTVVSYLLLATAGLVVAVFVGDLPALAAAFTVAAASTHVYGRLTDTAGGWMLSPAVTVAVVMAAAAVAGVEPEIAASLAVVNAGFAAGSLTLVCRIRS